MSGDSFYQSLKRWTRRRGRLPEASAARRSPMQVESLETRFLPTGTVSGFVFRDYNANGRQDAREPGVGGITVTAFDPNNVAVASATTSATAATLGQYALAIPGATTKLRVEFTGLPSYLQPGAFGPQSGTSVQFVDTSGGSATASMGVNNPADFSTKDATLADLRLIASCFTTGNQLRNADGTPNTAPAIISIPDAARGVLTTHTTLATANQVGSVYGLAYQRDAKIVYAATLMRRLVGFGPGGSGAIYKIDLKTNPPTVTTLIDLNALGAAFATGADPHPTANGTYDPNQVNGGGSPWFRDVNSIDQVGKAALGDLKISEDGRSLYTVNLNTRELIVVPLTAAGGLDLAGTVQRVAVPLTTANDARNFNNPGDIRPFGLGIKDGVVYVGSVYSAQTDAVALGIPAAQNRLRAYVYSFNPTTRQFGATPVLEFSLKYPRGSGDIQGTAPAPTDPRADWLPWTSGFSAQPGQQFPELPVYPQPVLSDIAFDNGDMILGFRDRMGDQGGYFAGSLDPNDPTRYTVISAGDTLRAGGNADGTWTIENNGTVGGVTSGGANTGAGPGGGEFYFNDQVLRDTSTAGNANSFGHQEITLGSLVQVPGARQVVASAFDAYAGFTGSVLWFDNAPSGTRRAGQNDAGDVTITQRPLPTGVTPTFTFGPGGVGDRLQVFDTQPPAPGSLSNPPIVSKANGFGALAALAQQAPLEIGNRVWLDTNRNGLQDADEPGIAGVTLRLLDGGGAQLATTTTDALGQYLFTDASVAGGLLRNTAYRVAVATGQAPLTGLSLTTANVGTDNAINSKATASGADGVISLTTGTDGQNNHTFDIGFVGVPPLASLCGNVTYDVNRNNVREAGEPGIGNVTLTLRDQNGNVVATTLTDANGDYCFRNLQPGQYAVAETQPATYLNESNSVGSAGGTLGVDFVTNIVLPGGTNAVHYDFLEVRLPTMTTIKSHIIGKVGLLASTIQNPQLVTAAEQYVNQLYNDVLGHAPDQAGIDNYVAQLLGGGTRADVARQVWLSPEYRALQVDVYYRQFFHRAADASGRQFFLNELLNGASEADVAVQLMTSAEYLAAHPDAASFLTGLYGDVLGRAPDAGSRSFWLPILADRGNWANVARAIFTSTEAASRVVNQMYVDYLHRVGDGAGVAYWAGLLASGQGSLCDVAVGLLGSNEYLKRA